jgi:hypothetical protein
VVLCQWQDQQTNSASNTRDAEGHHHETRYLSRGVGPLGTLTTYLTTGTSPPQARPKRMSRTIKPEALAASTARSTCSVPEHIFQEALRRNILRMWVLLLVALWPPALSDNSESMVALSYASPSRGAVYG